MRSLLLPIVFLWAAICLAQEPIQIRMMAGAGMGIPPKEATDPRSLARRAIFETFHRQNPDIRVVNAGGLEMVGPRAESMFLMSMAGDTAPDVFYVNFRQYYNYIDQGFCRPLDGLIAREPDSIARVNPIFLKVLRSRDGKIYAIPWFQVAQALYYRKDHFREAGLDPSRPPRTWDEFYEYARRLTRDGRSGFAFSRGPGYHWTNFLWQAGGDVVEQAEGGYARSVIDSPEAALAVDFYRKLVVDTWVDQEGAPVGPAAYVATDFAGDVNSGKVSMWFSYTNDVVLNMSDLNPALLGVAAMPAGPAGPINEVNAGMWAINAQIKDPKRIEACWRFIQFFAGDEAARVNTERFVELGLGNLVNPALLKKFGYDDIVAQVDPSYVEANEQLFKTGHPEPYGRNTQQVYLILDNALERAALEPHVPAIAILRDIKQEMDQKLLGYTPPEQLQRQRAWALGILVCLVTLTFGTVWYGISASRRRRVEFVERLAAGTKRSRIYRFMALCLLPAGLSILIWSYYPLFKGLVIAFQDYRIVQGTRWVGLDNFIAVFTQPIFWRSLLNSFVYVGLSILIGFFLPIFLALALNEIPRAKVFFRTVFYLPAMTSPIVIAFLWRQFYDKADTGLLNSVLGSFIGIVNIPLRWLGLGPYPTSLTYDWLGDPSLAMFAVVLPGIWAGAGPGSILYLAALKNIPEERYEAADLDGASWVHKILYIVIPGLKPLILINLLGVFIAGFKAMENIFVLTGGGPLYATHTVGLEVWTNAFMFLKFGYATAAAWVMGAILIGFTLIQIRNLLNMRFGAARL
ncbi:MAG TPA: extracellular solute-binding protein [Fimbriimonadaceae bacterium]|nr:extracellular solute-binding protein [Fimbriimonadaceae bacterium]